MTKNEGAQALSLSERLRQNHQKSYDCWLQYLPLKDPELLAVYRPYFRQIVCRQPSSKVMSTAAKEAQLGLSSLLGVTPSLTQKEANTGNLILSHIALSDREAAQALKNRGPEAFAVFVDRSRHNIRIVGKSDRAVLYGVFDLLRQMALHKPLASLDKVEEPQNKWRMLNHWDNFDGTIERGYAGGSIFYHQHAFVSDLSRVRDYARLLASIGINALSINNVNVHREETFFITEKYLPEIARIASLFREYGIQVFLSINFAAPLATGALETADPLEPSVRSWWKKQVEVIYRYIPDFGGFVVKADSEHRPGPFTYGRNHVDGANMLAEALAPYDGVLIWRCFVYNCLQDWRDRSTDRARAAYDHFKPLDGQFAENVILQIKNGPMDFQVREPVSPLFGAMPKTNQMMEFQMTQEYTGQQIHLYYLVPQWKEILDFDTFARGEGSTVASIVDGSLFGSRESGVTAVVNVGNDVNWTGYLLAQANFYGYGRLIWDSAQDCETITKEWICLTFGHHPEITRVILDMLQSSREIYESYTAPLGVGWMVNPGHHYGPNVDGYEYSRWGTYHFADWKGIGVDRTMASGTGFTGQYFPENAQRYESLAACPDELLLFFHHVPYTHRLHSGKTVIQHIYDTHFAGAERAAELVQKWQSLKPLLDKERFQNVLKRLEQQKEHAREWRDVINTYFYRKSGIADRHGRTIY